MVLNTIFLVREIRRNEQHDSFINAVTHELKTPVASIRLYLQTLQSRDLDESKRQEFYRIMLDDSDRLLHTIEQVLRAGSAGSGSSFTAAVARRWISGRSCASASRWRARGFTSADGLQYEEQVSGRRPIVLGEPDELRTAIWNLIDNAVKYSPGQVDIGVGSRRRTASASPSASATAASASRPRS
jgi:two-component system, OmpR family, sensor histidine kinase SenX3